MKAQVEVKNKVPSTIYQTTTTSELGQMRQKSFMQEHKLKLHDNKAELVAQVVVALGVETLSKDGGDRGGAEWCACLFIDYKAWLALQIQEVILLVLPQ